MLRRIVGLVLGIFAAAVMFALIDATSHKIFPPPAGLDPHDPAHMKTLVSQLPIGALISVILAWILGALAGGQVAMGIARDLRTALLVGFFMTAMGAMAMSSIPHPLWMWISGMLLPLPSAWLGARLASRPPAPPSSTPATA